MLQWRQHLRQNIKRSKSRRALERLSQCSSQSTLTRSFRSTCRAIHHIQCSRELLTRFGPENGNQCHTFRSPFRTTHRPNSSSNSASNTTHVNEEEHEHPNQVTFLCTKNARLESSSSSGSFAGVVPVGVSLVEHDAAGHSGKRDGNSVPFWVAADGANRHPKV